MAALYLGGIRLWPGVLIGDVLADLPHPLPLGPSVGQTIGNILEVVVAVVVLRRLVPGGKPLGRVRDFVRMLLALGIGTAISATVGTTSLRLGGVISTDAVPTVWRTWFLGDSCGAIVIVPLAVAFSVRGVRTVLRARWLELALVLTAVVVSTELGLRADREHILMYLVFPALIWAALRFGPPGATLAVAVTTILTVRGTATEAGAFAVHSITVEVLSIQLYVASATVATLVLACAVVERGQYAMSLQASRFRLVGAAHLERRRLERNLHDGAQQRLTALGTRLSLFEDALQPAGREFLGTVRELRTELAAAIEELRELAHGIHPVLLTDFGLEHALERIAASSGLPVTLEADVPRLDETLEATAYYLVAESLANAQKHARATRVEIRAAVADGVLRVSVADDGIGGAVQRPGSGLEGLRDRVETAGGEFRLVSSSGGGTRISAAIPIAAAEGRSSLAP